jgi:hypothetical protein
MQSLPPRQRVFERSGDSGIRFAEVRNLGVDITSERLGYTRRRVPSEAGIRQAAGIVNAQL